MTPQELESLVQQDNWRSALIDLVLSNELNPWDIDVDVMARELLNVVRESYRLNFNVPANMVLALAILLKYKSMQIEFKEEEEPLPEIDLEISDEKLIRKRPTMPLSLEELVEAVERTIEKVEKTERKRVVREVSAPPKIELSPEEVEREVEKLYTRITAMAKKERIFYSKITPQVPEDMVKTLLLLLFLSNNNKVELIQERIFEDIEVVPHGRVEENS
ncbi:MAG: hypothetical protein D6769_00325 [Methanobacteriota archaeon]|nr:MAG: hypothetical protein D6769_00325 [Euryarchaeota archaeon]